MIKGLALCLMVATMFANKEQVVHYHYHFEGSGRQSGARTLGKWCEGKAKTAYGLCYAASVFSLSGDNRRNKQESCAFKKAERIAACQAADVANQIAPKRLLRETQFVMDPNLTPRELTRWCRAKAQSAFGLCMTGSVFSVNSANRQNKQNTCRHNREIALANCLAADNAAAQNHLMIGSDLTEEHVRTLGAWCEDKAKVAHFACVTEAGIHFDANVRKHENEKCEHLKAQRIAICQQEDNAHKLAPAGLVEETHLEFDPNLTPRELTRWCRAKAQSAFGLCMTGSIFSVSSENRQNKQANCRLSRDQKLEACRIADEQAVVSAAHLLADPVAQNADSLCRLQAVEELTSCLSQADQTKQHNDCVVGHSARLASCDSDRALAQMRRLAKTPEEHLGFCKFSAETKDFWCRFWANLRGGEQKQERLDTCKAKLALKETECVGQVNTVQVQNTTAGHA